MVRWGHSPSVRLFEAAACGVPIISDDWPGIETLLEPGKEILLARDTADTLRYLRELPEAERVRIGARARARVLASHTAAHRAMELEGYVVELRESALQRIGS
jgi:spore maturation protein CgeB